MLHQLGEGEFTVRFFAQNGPKKGKYFARIRYRQEPQECSVVYDGENTKIKFDKPQRGLSSGQSIVIYDEDICLGGGIVK